MEKELIKKFKTIDKEDMDIFKVFDSVDEATKYVLKNVDCNNIYQR